MGFEILKFKWVRKIYSTDKILKNNLVSKNIFCLDIICPKNIL